MKHILLTISLLLFIFWGIVFIGFDSKFLLVLMLISGLLKAMDVKKVISNHPTLV